MQSIRRCANGTCPRNFTLTTNGASGSTPNYARDHYQRYINISLEGDYFYDIYGNFLTRGWLIFNNSQTTPQQFGNSLFKSSRSAQWFSGLVLTSDQNDIQLYDPEANDVVHITYGLK